VNTVVTDQYPALAFSSDGTNVLFALNATYCQTSAPFALCAGQPPTIRCDGVKRLVFTRPVRNLRFRCGCVDTEKKIATIEVQQGDRSSLVDLLGRTGGATTPVDVDLSHFDGVTALLVTETGADYLGFTIDDLRFEAPE
jgi:hypothetical protein